MAKTNQALRPCSIKTVHITQCKRETNYLITLYIIFVDMLVSLLSVNLLDWTAQKHALHSPVMYCNVV